MKHTYSFGEQETTINIFPTNVSKTAEVFSCIPAMMNRLRELAADHPRDVAIREDDGCLFATVPASWIKIQPKRKCNMTEEQRKASAERLAAYMEAKKNDAT